MVRERLIYTDDVGRIHLVVQTDSNYTRCPVCGRYYTAMKNGRLPHHVVGDTGSSVKPIKGPRPKCPGSGQTP